MQILIVVNQVSDWQFDIPGVEVVPARTYLADSYYSKLRGAKIFNLCRNYRYQSIGYYVSLLAAARGHKPIPTVATIQDLKSQTIIRMASEDLLDLVSKSFTDVSPQPGKFSMNIYFGQGVEEKFSRLCTYLFHTFEAPLLRADFNFDTQDKKWVLQNVNPITASDVPAEHHHLVTEAAKRYFAGRRATVRKKTAARYDLAILYGTPETEPASDEKAIQKFVKAAENQGFEVEVIQKDAYARVAEFDVLFIRETTAVNHHTFRFAQRAAAESLVVIDDPESILRCTNKVYLAELLDRHKLKTPKTLIVHKDNAGEVTEHLGLPCILKQPDSSFSMGVSKVESLEELREQLEKLLDKSDLVIAQEFTPTDFDWRIGILDKKPVYACKYHMARKHWQILKTEPGGTQRSGKVETLPVELAPRKVVRTALEAANLIGDGLYGVDIKQIGKDCLVIEVNDNPSIESGYEDAILKDDLYERIMEVLLRRVERLTNLGA